MGANPKIIKGIISPPKKKLEKRDGSYPLDTILS